MPDPLVLPYFRPPQTRRVHRNKWRFLPWLFAAIIPFVPFASGTSPIAEIWEMVKSLWSGGSISGSYGWLAARSLLAIPILAWRIRVDFTGRITWAERWCAYLLGALAWAAVISDFSGFLFTLRTFNNYALSLAISFILVAAIIACTVLSTEGDQRSEAPWVVMLLPYLVIAALCLLIFHEQIGVGWFLTLAVSLAGVVDLAVLLFATP